MMEEKKNKPLLERLLDAGYPADQVFHHESDLYVFITPLTEAVIDEWLVDNGFKRLKDVPLLMSKFCDQVTGQMMYDIAFQYLPYWEKKHEN